MIIIDSESNRWKRNGKKNKNNNNNKGKKAIVKGWEINDFVERLS